MVMAWEKGTGAKLFCTVMLQSERSQSNVLITEMTWDVIEWEKKMENWFCCSQVRKMSLTSGAAAETFQITRFEKIRIWGDEYR